MGDLEVLQKEVQALAGYVQTIGKAVLAKNGFMDEEPEYDGMGNGEHEDPMAAIPGEEEMLARMGKHGKYMKDEGMGGMEDPMMPPQEDPMGVPPDPMGMPGEEEMPYDEDEMAMAYMKSARMIKSMRARKGFAHEAEAKTDEHDAPFGDKDSTLDGNENSPAGDQGGEREDESFGPGGNSLRANANGVYKMRKEIARLTKQVQDMASDGQVISKAIVPARPAGPAEQAQEGQVQLTRDMQEQVKGRSYREINKFRESVGDLPKHGIIG